VIPSSVWHQQRALAMSHAHEPYPIIPLLILSFSGKGREDLLDQSFTSVSPAGGSIADISKNGIKIA